MRADNLEAPVLAEGDRDVAALKALGLEGKIVKLNRGESLVKRCEGLAQQFPRIILLTDWDAKGRQLCRRLREILEATGARADDSHWQRLRRACGSSTRTVEDLPPFLNSLRDLTSSAGRR